ncbi:esterase/lipase/thioesterase family protein [Striga asiatica]|uniref:Esterase/lipase/thioesterase family protein n=1 Tax=Striga asiatica TaxID=4170 RepID=A0A5A7QP30_STRAF|nr:esterase/lipase/thioesterase family protein [Striga asiatica]
MAGAGARPFSVGISPLNPSRNKYLVAGKLRPTPKPNLSVLASSAPTEKQSPRQAAPAGVAVNGVVRPKPSAEAPPGEQATEPQNGELTSKDYFEQSAELISRSDGGPPRWFSPLTDGQRPGNCPVLLSLPGVDGVGLGLLLHHERLGKIFDIWCLHIPLADRTPFAELVKLVESTVRLEHSRNPNRPIYLVGESFGGCLALVVAARNPDIDLILILANPATSFSRSQLQLQTLLPLSAILPEQLFHGLPYLLTLLTGAPLKMVAEATSKGLPLEQVIRNLTQETMAMLSNLSAMSDLLTLETILWKLDLLKSSSSFANSRLHAVKAQTLILARWIEWATSPVMLSTLWNGEIVRSLGGVPCDGPVLYVGYHMMLGLELVPLVSRFWRERNILLRGMAHPMIFTKLREGKLPALSAYDTFRTMGAVPVSAPNFYKLFSSNSHILLYPGGMREALHRKGEEYKLFWPERSEFVRMAAKFGAKIVPFGSVGEDDFGHLLLDYDDLMRIPYFKNEIEDLTDEAVKLRSEAAGEVANQDVHLPIIMPKVPGRFYYLFGKPIETQGREEELKCREKGHELYLQVKSEVEKCLAYLKEKRENDPYRNIFARLSYQLAHGFDSEVPTFDFRKAR